MYVSLSCYVCLVMLRMRLSLCVYEGVYLWYAMLCLHLCLCYVRIYVMFACTLCMCVMYVSMCVRYVTCVWMRCMYVRNAMVLNVRSVCMVCVYVCVTSVCIWCMSGFLLFRFLVCVCMYVMYEIYARMYDMYVHCVCQLCVDVIYIYLFVLMYVRCVCVLRM